MNKISLFLIMTSFSINAAAYSMNCFILEPISRTKVFNYFVDVKSITNDANTDKLKLVITHKSFVSNKTVVYAKSFGWVNSEGQFNFSLCTARKCDGSIVGKMYRKTIIAEYVMNMDTINTPSRTLRCEFINSK